MKSCGLAALASFEALASKLNFFDVVTLPYRTVSDESTMTLGYRWEDF